jgi:hypothetical protein
MKTGDSGFQEDLITAISAAVTLWLNKLLCGYAVMQVVQVELAELAKLA